MITPRGSVHEPEAELLSAEDAIQDGRRLRAMFRQRRQVEQPVPLHVPLWTLIEALDHLGTEALRQVVRRAQERLAAAADTRIPA